MKVFVVGHKGMLGHMVVRYFSQRCATVLTSDARYTAGPADPLISAAVGSGAEWIINAAGRIKQKSAVPYDLYLGNTLLPVQLKMFLKPQQKLVHASTDCVFSGRTGRYAWNAPRDAEDVYGLSKVLGESVAEAGKCHIIRTSIIGPELGSGSGLMGWFLSQQGQVNGYTNHFWNGITTLEWAKVCYELATGALPSPPAIIQAGAAQAVSKYDLLKLIAAIWPHPIAIKPVEASERVDRTLEPTLIRPALDQQIKELRAFAG